MRLDHLLSGLPARVTLAPHLNTARAARVAGLASAIKAMLWPRRRPAAPSVGIPGGASCARLAADDQWSRIAKALAEPIGHAETAVSCQRAAARQLDAALYSLDLLVDELSGILALATQPSADVIPLRGAPAAVQLPRVA